MSMINNCTTVADVKKSNKLFKKKPKKKPSNLYSTVNNSKNNGFNLVPKIILYCVWESSESSKI